VASAASQVGEQAVAGRDPADLEISSRPGQPVPQRSRPCHRPKRPARQDRLGQDQETHRDQQRDPQLHGGEHEGALLRSCDGEAEGQPGRRPDHAGKHGAHHAELQSEQAPCAHGEPHQQHATGQDDDDGGDHD